MRIKGKFKHFHSGQTGIRQKLHHFRSCIAKILGNKGKIGEPSCQDTDKIHTGPLAPNPVFCCFVSGRNSPVAFKAAEMIDPDDVVQA